MFSLIITLVAIALVIALALASMYYGGSAWVSGGAKARATQLTNEVEQLRGAITMHLVDKKKLPSTFQELVDGEYLKNPPERWRDASNFFTHTIGGELGGLDKDICLEFNKSRNVPFVPECSDENYRQMVVCCSNLNIDN